MVELNVKFGVTTIKPASKNNDFSAEIYQISVDSEPDVDSVDFT